VKISADEPPCHATIVDLSVEGCLLVFQKRQSLSNNLKVELIFEVNHLPFRVRGQVRGIRSSKMVGLQFIQLNGRVRRELEALIEELKEDIIKRLAELKARGQNGSL